MAHRCTECGGPINPLEIYRYATGVDDGRICEWKLCEGCHIVASFLYAKERSEGCAEHESWPPIGMGCIRHEDLEWSGLSLEDDYADTWFEPGEREHFVVRWSHIDAARKGLDSTPFLNAIRLRMMAHRLVLGPLERAQ